MNEPPEMHDRGAGSAPLPEPAGSPASAAPDAPPSQARLEWQRILDHEDLEEILRLMTDPTEAGHRRRQSTPFAGILAVEERRTIREQLL